MTDMLTKTEETTPIRVLVVGDGCGRDVSQLLSTLNQPFEPCIQLIEHTEMVVFDEAFQPDSELVRGVLVESSDKTLVGTLITALNQSFQSDILVAGTGSSTGGFSAAAILKKLAIEDPWKEIPGIFLRGHEVPWYQRESQRFGKKAAKKRQARFKK